MKELLILQLTIFILLAVGFLVKKIKIVATVMFYVLAVASVIGGFYVIFNLTSVSSYSIIKSELF